jgi:hypothetical protein
MAQNKIKRREGKRPNWAQDEERREEEKEKRNRINRSKQKKEKRSKGREEKNKKSTRTQLPKANVAQQPGKERKKKLEGKEKHGWINTISRTISKKMNVKIN